MFCCDDRRDHGSVGPIGGTIGGDIGAPETEPPNKTLKSTSALVTIIAMRNNRAQPATHRVLRHDAPPAAAAT